VYEYLGLADRRGVRYVPGAAHLLGAEQLQASPAFAARFLLDQAAATDVFEEPYGAPSEALVPWRAPG
jgi:hypothetical protein